MDYANFLYTPAEFGSFLSIPSGHSAILIGYLRSLTDSELKQYARHYETEIAANPTRFDYIEILSYISTIKRERRK